LSFFPNRAYIRPVKEGMQMWMAARWFGALSQDVRFALRLMRRNRVFTAVAVLTFALGIGANTAVFSLVDAVILHPLPYPEPDRLFMLWTVEGRSQRPMKTSYPDFRDWQAQARAFATMAAFRGASFNVTGAPQAEAVSAIASTPGLFETFGVAPALGRTFQNTDGTRVALISDGLWVRRFAADPRVVGRTIRLDEEQFAVLGVLPRGFHFQPRGDTEPDVFVPIDRSSYRTSYFVSVLARSKRGVAREGAQAEMNTVAARIARANAEVDRRQGVLVDPLHRYVVQDARGTALLLLGAVAFLLLIACANVANLLLARGVGREREVAIRVAIGASRARLVRQMLTESVLLALIGAGLGMALAYVALPLVAGIAPEGTSFLTRVRDNGVRVSATVLWFTAGTSFVAAILFGILPAIRATRPITSSSAATSSRRVPGVLVTSEVALSFVLVAGAVLMLSSLWRLLNVDPGFRTDNLVTMGVSLPDAKYKGDADRAGYYASAVQRLAALPGVQSAAAVASLPITRDPGAINSFAIEGSGRTGRASFNEVSAGYFRTMGIPPVRGRDFSDADRAGAPGVAIVNRSMARRYWPNGDGVGRAIVVDRVGLERVAGEARMHNTPQRVEIIGIVADNRQLGLDDDDARPTLFLASAQRPPAAIILVVRTARTPSAAFIKQAGDQVTGIDPDVPLLDVRTMDQLIAVDTAPRRFVLALIGLFALVAVALAAAGIYGVVSHSVARRTQEIAVRLALGARPGEVVHLIARQHFAWVLAGVAIGALGASALTGLLANQLFGVEPADVLTCALAGLLLVIVGLLADVLPASRATRVAPASVLRNL
jgi:putative ABC transport system permease protein